MLLLQRISIQLESFTLTPGFANSSSIPPLPSLDFTADVTARWINILWFLSLIFSLAAALFGILVKQWIREYMQWNSALASPRQNVLVRQIRFEAWNKWNVPATIAAVPALLEIALVLFVCGLVVLLWTLDAVVSIVITTAVAVFLSRCLPDGAQLSRERHTSRGSSVPILTSGCTHPIQFAVVSNRYCCYPLRTHRVLRARRASVCNCPLRMSRFVCGPTWAGARVVFRTNCQVTLISLSAGTYSR